MGTLIALTAEEAGFLALFTELGADSQALLRALVADLAGAGAAGGAP